MTGEKLTCTVPETAAMLGVSARLVYDMIARGEMQSIRLGRRVLIARRTIDELVGGAS